MYFTLGVGGNALLHPLSVKFEADAPAAVFEVVARYAETAYFGSVPDVCTYAGTGVIVAYTYYAKCLGGIFWQLAQVHYRCGF